MNNNPTLSLSDTQILHLLQAAGIPPGLEHPPVPPNPPDTISSPWTKQGAARGPIAGLLGIGLGLGLLVAILHPNSTPTRYAAALPTNPVSVVPATLTLMPPTAVATGTSTATATATAIPSATPTVTVIPPVTATATVPPTATVASILPQPPPRPPQPGAIPPTATPIPPLPAPLPTTAPPATGGSGAWGNDWSGSIYDRSATIGAPTLTPGP